ncbi:MAG: AarF/ABC1/UbiB kinase family protein [Silvanigrellales bacterium]|nr:AarF/ABC1/UbiB kinase family protein [Silvanigrellales bacterium]
MFDRRRKTTGERDSRTRESKRRQQRLLEHLSTRDLRWISPLAARVRCDAEPLGHFLAEVLARIAQTPHTSGLVSGTRWELTKGVARMLFPNVESLLGDMEKGIESLEVAFGDISSEILRDPDVTSEIICPALEVLALAIEKNPRLVVFLGSPDLLREAFGEVGGRLAGILSIVPALSQRAAANFPELKETLFVSLLALSQGDRLRIYGLAEDVLREVYKAQVFPRLRELLDGDPRSKVLAPILLGAIEAIPGESCLNAVLSIACTPQHQLTAGRIIAIAVQELGGLYVKISQVLAEICPPSLAKELRTSQDDAGGLHPSIEKSWETLLATLARPEMSAFEGCFDIPSTPVPHFAAASVGALYELKLTPAGCERFGKTSLLVKIQRPGLEGLLTTQCNHLLLLCDKAREGCLLDESLGKETRLELLGLSAAIRRSVLNYFKQSSAELDFCYEEKNAARVREALKDEPAIRVPTYQTTLSDVVVMERMPGTKVTKIVQAKYLERKEIADAIIHAYLELVFTHGVVWADPHPGNILFDDVSNRVAMIDLNPCFVWDRSTREHFKHLLYRLLLRDPSGVYDTLYHLVDNRESLHNNSIFDDLSKFLNAPFDGASLTRFVGEFIRLLSEHNVDLRVEVQAALRGLSQLALTANAVSARNGFSLLLRRYFGVREMLQTAWDVGLFRAAKVVTRTLFDLTRALPEEDVGPVLDERDIRALQARVKELSRASVCDIRIVRVSPEDHTALRMSVDGSSLLVTSEMRLEIVEKRRPATVRYVILLPTQRWLKERQEFVKLTSIARNFCTIDCLEQLRRHSLDDYWRTVEEWNKTTDQGLEQLRLVRSVRTAARKLLALRFAGIWDSPLAGLPKASVRTWRLLLRTEHWREESEYKYVSSLSRTPKRARAGGKIAFGTIYRLKLLAVEGILLFLRGRVKKQKFAMHLLPMNTRALAELILFNLGRNSGSATSSGHAGGSEAGPFSSRPRRQRNLRDDGR